MIATLLQTLEAGLPDWNALHFLRPDWLWALLALPLILAAVLYRQRRSEAWRQAVDAHLLSHLLVAGGHRRARLPWAILLGWTLAVLALAGPSWRQQAQPMFQAGTPLVVVLDLSSRTTATDLPPSRLLQARAKIGALLRDRQGGQVGLVVYADDAYTVAPLTDDTSNVALYLDALAPDVMPRDGQHADRGIDWAAQLLRQTGSLRGRILLISDQADAAAALAAAQARGLGLQVSVLGLGTPAGAAYRDGNGQIAQAALDETGLRAVATAGGGRYQRIAADDRDLRALGVLDASDGSAQQRPGQGRQWQDEGFWLLPPLMLLALLAFRRRAVLAALLAVGLLPLSGNLHAQARSTGTAAPGTLWQRADQREHQRIAEGVQAYRNGDFDTARARFDGIDSDAGWYNLGNVLARKGDYDGAIAAYDRALAKHPGMADAVANRAVVDAARKRRPPQNKDQKDTSGQDKDPGQQKQKPPGQQGQQDGKQQDGKQQDGKQDQQGQQGQQDPKQGQQGAPQKPPQGGGADKDTSQAGPQGADAKAQAQADAEQRQRMQQAMQQSKAAEQGTPAARGDGRTPQQREEQQAVDAWMRRVPDDPGALLRTKFQLENERRKKEGR